ncbi:MAG: M1 family metallopeptidase [Actinomycetota bacterium]|nr:M1 family metallopeptidase [Actinomycetota bacterium]
MPRRSPVVVLVAALALFACGGGDGTPTTTTLRPGTSTTTTSSPPTGATTSTTLPPAGFGAPGIGDPYFPNLGNGGFDVEHYLIETTVDPETGEITRGETTITATATAGLAGFYLDFRSLEVLEVAVDGATAVHEADGADLRITPTSPIAAGEEFVVRVRYRGTPGQTRLPGLGLASGWIITPEEVYVVAEPDGAHTWFPGSDHPADKATFTIVTTVPEPFAVVSNGTLAGETHSDGMATFVWEMDDPMATYLATIVVAELESVDRTGLEGIEIRDHLPADLAAEDPRPLQRTAEWIEFFETWFGPYPFASYGHVVVSGFGAALESQTMSVMDRAALVDVTVIHELAHQWFGDSVSIATWQDIWLNEGFATFAEFLWIEDQLGRDAMEADIEGRHAFMKRHSHRPISDPGVDELFGSAVYQRGGLTLHALRVKVGDDVMRDILRTYVARYTGANASTEDFIAVAEDIAARDLSVFFDAWLYESELPPLP